MDLAPCGAGTGNEAALPGVDPCVLRRMTEFLGGATLEAATGVFVVGRSEERSDPFTPYPPTGLPELLRQGREISRSMWDRRYVVVDLDIEYVNFDFPGDAFLNARRSFGLQRPVVRAVREIMGAWGIEPLHLFTGRGHHFVWTVDRRSAAFRRLAGLGRVPAAVADRYACPEPPGGESVDPTLGRAFAGLGLIMEYLGHRVRDLATEESAIPVELSELDMAGRTRGLEIVVIDLSEYGDLLSARQIPVPFSPYLKPLRNANVYGTHVAGDAGPMWVIPDPGLPEREALHLMRDESRVRELARVTETWIPEASQGMEGLVGAYETSELARVHRHFYSEEHHPPELWPETYDRTPLASLPADAALALRAPNDLLLRPSGIFRVVEALMEAGWHPRHIAGLIRSRYERDHGWGWRWHRESATARADHYVRLFSGMLTLGRGPVEADPPP
jgi:hypothetical protein